MRKVAALPVLLFVAVATSGWFYLYNPAIPGPRVRLALPLDELSHHASASLLWFAVVWTAAAALLGLYARWARIERLHASLLFAVGIGTYAYLQTGVSVAVVRQVSAPLGVRRRIPPLGRVPAGGDRRARGGRARCRAAPRACTGRRGRARRRRRPSQSAACRASRRGHGPRPRLHARRRRPVRPRARRRRLRRAARCRAWSRSAAPPSLAGGGRSRRALGHPSCSARHQRRHTRLGRDPHAAARPPPRLRPAGRRRRTGAARSSGSRFH